MLEAPWDWNYYIQWAEKIVSSSIFNLCIKELHQSRKVLMVPGSLEALHRHSVLQHLHLKAQMFSVIQGSDIFGCKVV